MVTDDVPPPPREPPLEVKQKLVDVLTHYYIIRDDKQIKCFREIDKLMHESKLSASNKYFVLSYCPPSLLTDTLNKCCFFAHIYHDKDEGKVPHWHYYLGYSMNKNIFNLAKEFHCDRYSFMIENVRNRKACLRYLIHIDYPEKAQYALGSVVSNNFESVERACRSIQTVHEDNAEFLKDMFRLNAYEMACKYGRDFIKNYKNYASFCCSLNHCMQFTPIKEGGEIDDDLNQQYFESFAYTYSGALGYNPYKIEGVKFNK